MQNKNDLRCFNSNLDFTVAVAEVLNPDKLPFFPGVIVLTLVKPCKNKSKYHSRILKDAIDIYYSKFNYIIAELYDVSMC
jgi:hypothetical protein